MSATVNDLSRVLYSGDYRADSLLSNPVWNFWPDGRNVLYFSFDVSAGPAVGKEDWQYSAVAFNANQKNAARDILHYAQQLTGIRFTETNNGSQADVHFAAVNLPNAQVAGLAYSGYGYSFNGDGTITQLDADAMVYLDNAEHSGINTSPSPGSMGYEVLLHEIGHMLGLLHPFDSTRPLAPAQDTTNNTVMSYTQAGAPKTEFQEFDLLALQWLYGADGLGGLWGLNSANGPSLNSAPIPPTVFIGTSLAEVFVSKPANETFDGAGGVDTVVFDGTRASYTLARQGAGWKVADSVAGRDGSDSLSNVERLQFSDLALALDLDGAAGVAARLMGVLVGAGSLSNRALVGAVLDVVDSGMAPDQLASLALQAVLGTGASNAAAVAHVYGNLFHQAPDAATARTLVSFLDSGAYSQADLVTIAATLQANADNIGLAALSTSGLAYV